MNPVLFELPWGTAHAYGTLILLGGVLTVPGVVWDARRRGLARGRLGSFVVDFYLVLVFGAAIGGRLLHVLTVPGDYWTDPLRVVALNDAGFVFFGSLLAIAAGWGWLAQRHGVPFSTSCDVGATWMALGHAFGRLGCWSAGCCWGAPGADGWGVRFPADAVVAMAAGAPMHGGDTVPLHPVQLYEASGLFVLFAVLLLLRWRRGPEAPWRQASRYALGYGVIRLVTEVFRADTSRGHLLRLEHDGLASLLRLPSDQPLVLSIAQAIALALLVTGAWGLHRSRRAPAMRG